MAIPKLALIPSGFKAGKLYSVLPTNGDGDFTTTRNTVATRVNENGLIEEVASNVPRLDYSDGGCPSLLLEPQRLQKIQYSEDFSDSSWSKLNSSIVSNSVISPDGTLNADKIIDNTVNTAHRFISGSFTTTATNYTFSIFVKKSEIRYAYLRGNDSGGTYISGTFDLQDGVVTETIDGNLSIQDYGNGWFRVIGTAVSNGNGSSYFELRTSKSPIYSNYLGNGTDSLYIFGAQAEQGSYPTSYIPNYGTSAGITRSADTATGAGNASTFNDSSGVLMAEISALADDGTNRFLGVSNGSLSNRVNIIYNTSNELLGQIQGAGSLSGGGVDILSSNKIALKYKLGDNQLWVNGIKVDSNTSTLGSTVGLNVLDLSAGNGSFPFYGNTEQIQYFDSALNDSDLEKLTSWTSFTAMANGQSYTII
jgi:hypothetical protein